MTDDREDRDARGRFLKGGRPGNPNGRPPKRASSDELAKLIDPQASLILKMNRKVRLKQDGTEATRLEDAHERLYQMAMKGDVAAMKLYLELAGKAHEVEKQYKHEILYFARSYKNRWGWRFASAEAAGKPLKQLPHPDDLVIDGQGNVALVGPANPEDQRVMLAHLWLRDQCLFVLEELHRDNDGSDNSRAIERIAKRKLAKANAGLPPRLKKRWVKPDDEDDD